MAVCAQFLIFQWREYPGVVFIALAGAAIFNYSCTRGSRTLEGIGGLALLGHGRLFRRAIAVELFLSLGVLAWLEDVVEVIQKLIQIVRDVLHYVFVDVILPVLFRCILLFIDRAAELPLQGLLLCGRHLLDPVDVEIAQVLLAVEQLLQRRVPQLLDLLPLLGRQIIWQQLGRLSYIFLGQDLRTIAVLSLLMVFLVALLEAAELLPRRDALHCLVGGRRTQKLLLKEQLVDFVHEVRVQLRASSPALHRRLRILNALIGDVPAGELASRALFGYGRQRALGALDLPLQFV